MSDLLREVDDAMHQERMAKIWHENRPYIIGFIVGTIILTGVFSFYRSWNLNVQQEQTAAVLDYQSAENYPQNILEMEKIDLRDGIRGVAMLHAAGTFLDEDKPDQALALYTRVAQDKGIDSDLRDLGILMQTRLMMNESDNKTADSFVNDGKTLIENLRPVLSNAKSPWLNPARIEAAVISAHIQGNYDAAIAYLDSVIKTEHLPQSLKDRANALIHIYTLEKAG